MNAIYQSDLRDLLQSESQLAARIDALYKRLDRIDCLDEEQRAELYSILQALKHDSQSTGELLAGLSARMGQETADA